MNNIKSVYHGKHGLRPSGIAVRFAVLALHPAFAVSVQTSRQVPLRFRALVLEARPSEYCHSGSLYVNNFTYTPRRVPVTPWWRRSSAA
jgi:hypothetical protein